MATRSAAYFSASWYAADDVAPAGDLRALGFVIDVFATIVDHERYERAGSSSISSRTSSSVHSRTSRTYRRPRVSSSASVSGLIMPRSATMHMRLIR
jgi:hypothetical protein